MQELNGIGAREKMQGEGIGRLGAATVRNGLILKGSVDWEQTASAKSLRQEWIWCVSVLVMRPVCLQQIN